MYGNELFTCAIVIWITTDDFHILGNSETIQRGKSTAGLPAGAAGREELAYEGFSEMFLLIGSTGRFSEMQRLRANR